MSDIPPPEAYPSKNYREYVSRIQSLKPMSRYDDYRQSTPGATKTFGVGSPPNRQYPDPTPSQVGQSDTLYEFQHKSEKDLERVSQTGSRAVYGIHEDLPIHGPAEYHGFYPNWASIGTQYTEPAPATRPLPENEEKFLKEIGFEFKTLLGTGAFGSVWYVVSKQLFKDPVGQYIEVPIACKILNISKYKKDELRAGVAKLTREADLHLTLSHINIVECNHVFYTHDEQTGFPYCRCLLFMELCDGDLKSFIDLQQDKHFDEGQAFEMLSQTTDAIVYLHDQNVCHLDIKCQNIMYRLEGNVIYKLADFGISKRFTPQSTGISQRFSGKVYGMIGTRMYAPPEVLRTPKGLSEAKPIDIYCLGVVLAECLSGRAKWRSLLTDLKVWTPQVFIQWGVSQICAHLICLMTEVNPSNRPTVHQIRQHEWFVSDH